MTDGTAINDAIQTGTRTLDPVVEKRASALALRIMARLRGSNLLPAEGGESQDEFEATELTRMIGEELAR